MPTIQITPSDITITNPPLQGAFGKLEIEVAAAFIVLVCQRTGSFQPCTFGQIAEAIDENVELMIAGGEVLDVDFQQLVSAGFARWSSDEDAIDRTIEFTELGLERLLKSTTRTAGC